MYKIKFTIYLRTIIVYRSGSLISRCLRTNLEDTRSNVFARILNLKKNRTMQAVILCERSILYQLERLFIINYLRAYFSSVRAFTWLWLNLPTFRLALYVGQTNGFIARLKNNENFFLKRLLFEECTWNNAFITQKYKKKLRKKWIKSSYKLFIDLYGNERSF